MKLMVLDGNSLLNRSYYGIRPLTNREGLYTHAIFGFLTTLLRLEGEEAPDALCVTFDVHAPTFRHKAEESYKATRKPMPEELRMQMPVMKEVLDALNIPRYELAGWEADDLLGTISRKCEAQGWDCVVVTGDKDSLQLITDHTKVKLVSTRMGRTTTRDMTAEAFQEEYGFAPIHMIDLKALMGDTSDNISGVPGIGEKTAMDLVRRYGSIDTLYEKLPDIEAKPAAIRKLTAGEDSARRSYWLATIVTDAPLDFRPEDNLRKSPGSAAYPLFLRLEFTKLLDRFALKPEESGGGEAEVFTGTCTMEALTDDASVSHAAEVLRADGGPVWVRLSENLDLAVLHREAEEGANAYVLDRSRFSGDWETALRTLFGSEIPKAGHNVKDLQRLLLPYGTGGENWVWDTALMAWLIDAASGHYELDRLTVKYGNFRIGRASDAEEGEQLSLLDGNAEKWDQAKRYADYAAEAAASAALRPVLESRLDALGLRTLYETMELPLCPVLAEMEGTGCLVDRKALWDFGNMASQKAAEQEKLVHDLAGERFNLNSPKQLGEVLFDKLGLPHGKKTKTGWSTNADTLEKLRDQPIVKAVLDYRQYAKLKSTYADGLLKAIGPDGRVHTSFQMTATATGRLSSAEPNLQNIPTRTDLGSEIRKMFIPAAGNVLVDADYSQIELRLLAHISGDQAMIRAFTQGQDIHTATAAQVFHVAPEDVTGEMRRSAKAVNFGIVYGISAFSLAADIGTSVADAKAYMEAYFETFPGVRRYMDGIVEKARQDGFVETLFQRRRDLPELKSSNYNLRSFGERVALNMPIQGTAADVVKLAMIAVRNRLLREGLQGRLVLQIHDELVVECPEGEAEQVAALLRQEMEGVADWSVPLIAEAHWGRNWLEAKG